MYCRSCDYNLAGIPAGKCPECSTAFDPADPTSYEARPSSVARQQQYVVGIGLVVVMGAVVWIGFHNFLAPFFLLVGAVGLIAVVAGIRLRPSAPSRALLLLALLPMLTMLGLFYSLAVHMHQHLGSWPKSIGTEGFPPPLQIHADAAYWYFGLLVLANLLLLPVGLLLCTFVRGWRAESSI